MNPLASIAQPSAPVVTVGVPEGLDPEAVRRRKAALIAAGTDPLLAEGLAINAETEQARIDARVAEEAKTPKSHAKEKGASK